MEKNEAIAALSALAHETRLEIFRLLVRYGPEGLPVGQITEHIPIPPATMSFHLANLQKAGLLTSRRESRQIYYAARMKLMTNLVGFLTENCCTASSNAAFPGGPCCPSEPERNCSDA